jgi:hypothetical protein
MKYTFSGEYSSLAPQLSTIELTCDLLAMNCIPSDVLRSLTRQIFLVETSKLVVVTVKTKQDIRRYKGPWYF